MSGGSPKHAPKYRISVIGGGGMVGAATVNALILKNVAAEVLIVDVAEQAALGQALDIADASFNSPGYTRVGNYQEAGQSDIVIITAGYPQKPGEPRSMLLGKNKAILKSVFTQMMPLRPDMKVLLVANPVDALTHMAQKLSGLPKNQVFGSGTYLDSGRLREHIAGMLGVHPKSVHAFVLGEHGDNQFVAWDSATVGNMKLIEHPSFQGVDLDDIRKQVARKAYAIIEAKRSTYFGIGMCAATIAEAVMNNTCEIMPLVHYVESKGVYCSWPCSIGSMGVEDTYDVNLSAHEQEQCSSAILAIAAMAAETETIEA